MARPFGTSGSFPLGRIATPPSPYSGSSAPSTWNRARAKSWAVSSPNTNPPTRILPCRTATLVAPSLLSPNGSRTRPSPENDVSIPPEGVSAAIAQAPASTLMSCMLPTITTPPPGRSATAVAPPDGAPGNAMRRRPLFPNVVSGAPPGVNRAAPNVAVPSAMARPTTTKRPSGRTTRSLARSAPPKSVRATPPTPKEVSSVPLPLKRKTMKSAVGVLFVESTATASSFDPCRATASKMSATPPPSSTMRPFTPNDFTRRPSRSTRASAGSTPPGRKARPASTAPLSSMTTRSNACESFAPNWISRTPPPANVGSRSPGAAAAGKAASATSSRAASSVSAVLRFIGVSLPWSHQEPGGGHVERGHVAVLGGAGDHRAAGAVDDDVLDERELGKRRHTALPKRRVEVAARREPHDYRRSARVVRGSGRHEAAIRENGDALEHVLSGGERHAGHTPVAEERVELAVHGQPQHQSVGVAVLALRAGHEQLALPPDDRERFGALVVLAVCEPAVAREGRVQRPVRRERRHGDLAPDRDGGDARDGHAPSRPDDDVGREREAVRERDPPAAVVAERWVDRPVRGQPHDADRTRTALRRIHDGGHEDPTLAVDGDRFPEVVAAEVHRRGPADAEGGVGGAVQAERHDHQVRVRSPRVVVLDRQDATPLHGHGVEELVRGSGVRDHATARAEALVRAAVELQAGQRQLRGAHARLAGKHHAPVRHARHGLGQRRHPVERDDTDAPVSVGRVEFAGVGGRRTGGQRGEQDARHEHELGSVTGHRDLLLLVRSASLARPRSFTPGTGR